mgnify:CR=1 FL=1
MNEKEQLKELELRVFELEQTIEIFRETILTLSKEVQYYNKEYQKTEITQTLKRESLLTIGEVADILNITESQVNDWIKEEKLFPIQIAKNVYFDRNEIKRIFREMMINDKNNSLNSD